MRPLAGATVACGHLRAPQLHASIRTRRVRAQVVSPKLPRNFHTAFSPLPRSLRASFPISAPSVVLVCVSAAAEACGCGARPLQVHADAAHRQGHFARTRAVPTAQRLRLRRRQRGQHARQGMRARACARSDARGNATCREARSSKHSTRRLGHVAAVPSRPRSRRRTRLTSACLVLAKDSRAEPPLTGRSSSLSASRLSDCHDDARECPDAPRRRRALVGMR
eukprot:939724-Pleurochrysis_carterae.AAC.7